MTVEELNGKNKEEIKAILVEKGIEFDGKANKEELISLLVEPTSDEETTEPQVPEVTKIEFRTQKDKNFVGFVHPTTRKLVTVDGEGKLFIDEKDIKALDIARSAVDLVEI